MADAGRATRPDLVQVAEHVEPRPSAAVVQLAVCQHAEQGRLADVGVTQHGQTQVDGVTVIRHLRRDSQVRSGQRSTAGGVRLGGQLSGVGCWGSGLKGQRFRGSPGRGSRTAVRRGSVNGQGQVEFPSDATWQGTTTTHSLSKGRETLGMPRN